MQISRNDIDVLKFYDDFGVDESCGDEPFKFFSESACIFEKKTFDVVKKNSENVSVLKAKQVADELVSGVESLGDLQKIISEFSLNLLSKFASHGIYGVGVESPELLVITEMPNAEEDRSGVALSGDTGELLKKILKAINSSVETNVYTFPASPFRAPGARMPTFEEMEISVPFIKKFIELLKPKVILSMGSVPTDVLLGHSEPITVVRGKWFEYNGVPVMPTFALSYLLNNVEAKKKTWADLQLLVQKL